MVAIRPHELLQGGNVLRPASYLIGFTLVNNLILSIKGVKMKTGIKAGKGDHPHR